MSKAKWNILTAIVVVVVLAFMLATAGCIEEQQKPKVWGQGELPADFAAFFGTDNNARLNKAQSDMLNRQQVVIHGMDQTKDGKTVHIPGLIDAVTQLDSRVKALEAVDPDEVAK